MGTELKSIAQEDRNRLEHMFQFYLYDMSEFAGWPISTNGMYAYPDDLLAQYWENADHHPYFILTDDEVAGFCLVRPSPIDHRIWDVGQFFVLRKFRGKGVGRLAFSLSLRGRSGQWQVRVLPENLSAYQFWRTAIGRLTDGAFSEIEKEYSGQTMTYFSFYYEE